MRYRRVRGGVRPARILVVDDERDTVSLSLFLLRKHGYQAAGTSDPVKGLAIAKTLIPDLAILNFIMPNLLGTDIVRALREEPKTNKMFLIVSSGGSRLRPELAKEAGADEFLSLPFDPEKLLEMVERGLDLKR